MLKQHGLPILRLGSVGLAILLAGLLWLPAPALAQGPGDFDAIFPHVPGNPDGIFFYYTNTGIIPIGSSNDVGTGVAVQPNGKIVVVGYSENGSNRDFAVARFNSDGSLDTSFDTDGKVTTSVASGDDYGQSVAIQPDGKIVVAGYGWNGSSSSETDIALVRYNIDGSLDNTFGSGGKVTTSIGSGNDVGRSIALHNGKIVVVGYSFNGTVNDFALVRYNDDGSLDNTFDSDGIVTTPVGSSNDYGNSVAVQQADGKIVVAGYSWNGSSDTDIALVRYNDDGSLDNTFDSDGKVTIPIGSGDDRGFSVALQPNDNKIVVAGYSYNGTDNDLALIRVNYNDGSLDNTFDSDGIVTTPVGSGNNFGSGVGVQADGKIVVAGTSFNGSDDDFDLVRYNADGSLDTTFGDVLGGGGIVAHGVGSGDDIASSIALQTDGKIVVAGQTWNGTDYDFALVRYHGDPTGSSGGAADLAIDDGGVPQEVYVGESFDLTLQIQNAANLYAVQTECGFDPAVISGQGSSFGNFFAPPPDQIVAANSFDNGSGTWLGGISQKSPAAPLSGSGELATLTYQAVSPAPFSLNCANIFSDRDGFELTTSTPTSVYSSTLSNITILDFAALNGAVTYQGRLDHAGINVTGAGVISFSEVTVSSGAFTNTGQLKLGSYDIRADAASYLPICLAQAIAGDVSLPAAQLPGGDINADEQISLGDATLLTSDFNNPVGSATEPLADINNDGDINILDLAMLAGNYNLTGCQVW